MYYNKHNWINTTELAAISLEYFFTESLFKGDLSRAVYATSDYAYRRRFELLDTSRDFENVEASSLQFPFMSYRITDNWKPVPSKRIFKLEEAGYSAASQLGNLRIIQVINTVNILLHYDREDDARLAYDRLAFLSSNKRWVTHEATYHFDKLEVPARISVKPETIKFAPAVNETDWLKQNRLFVLSLDVDVDSMVFFPPEQSLDGADFDPEPFVLSETVVMEFIAGKDPVITSISEALEDNSITLNSFLLDRVTKTTAKLSWNIQEQSTLDSLVLKINGKSYDLNTRDYTKTVRSLLAGAEYQADLYATRDGYSKHFTLRITTVSGATSNTDIIGTTW